MLNASKIKMVRENAYSILQIAASFTVLNSPYDIAPGPNWGFAKTPEQEHGARSHCLKTIHPDVAPVCRTFMLCVGIDQLHDFDNFSFLQEKEVQKAVLPRVNLSTARDGIYVQFLKICHQKSLP